MIKQSVTFNKAAKHTDIIGIGGRFNDPAGNYNDMIRMLKQTSQIFINSEMQGIFKDVKPGRSVIETTQNYLRAIRKFNADDDSLHFFIEKEKDKDYSLNVEITPADSNTIYHMYIDFLPFLEKEYPDAFELFMKCLLTLHNKYSLMYGASYYLSPDYTAERMSEAMHDPEEYGLDAFSVKWYKKLYNHYDKYEHIYTRYFYNSSTYHTKTDALINNLNNRQGCNYPKLKLLNEWFDLFLNILTEYPNKDLLFYEESTIREAEAYNECSFEDMCDNGCPVMIRDIFGLSWWGDSLSTEETASMLGEYAGNFGELSIFEKHKAVPGGKIPKKLIDSPWNNFIRDLVNLIILGNNVRDRFITKKYNFLR
jgi:hypothetical protein